MFSGMNCCLSFVVCLTAFKRLIDAMSTTVSFQYIILISLFIVSESREETDCSEAKLK